MIGGSESCEELITSPGISTSAHVNTTPSRPSLQVPSSSPVLPTCSSDPNTTPSRPSLQVSSSSPVLPTCSSDPNTTPSRPSLQVSSSLTSPAVPSCSSDPSTPPTSDPQVVPEDISSPSSSVLSVPTSDALNDLDTKSILLKISHLENTLTNILRDNLAMKTQINSLQSQLDSFKVKTLATSSTQTHTSTVDQVEATVPTSNRFCFDLPHVDNGNVSADIDFQTTKTRKSSKHSKDHDGINAHIPPSDTVTSNGPRRSAFNILSSLSIPDRATSVLIGDSVIRFINPRRLSTPGTYLQKICVPGMTCSDLQRWLDTLGVNKLVQHVTIHVGVNDCPSGSIKEDTWNGIISSVRRAFPTASVHMSSIVPAKGYHNLNNSIFPSNRNLSNICHRLGIHIISHVSSFRSPSGPTLYSDHIHPNKRGTAQLAIHLKISEASERPSETGPFSLKSTRAGNSTDFHSDRRQHPSQHPLSHDSFHHRRRYQRGPNPFLQGGPSLRSRSVFPNGPSYRPSPHLPSQTQFHAFPRQQDQYPMTSYPRPSVYPSVAAGSQQHRYPMTSYPRPYHYPSVAAGSQQHQYPNNLYHCPDRVIENLHSSPQQLQNDHSAYQNFATDPFPGKPVPLFSPSLSLQSDCFPPLQPHPLVRSLVS